MMRTATFAAVVAIVAAVLSLAAPATVDAQTPTLTVSRNTIGQTIGWADGLASGTYYQGGCMSETAPPASCPYNNMGRLPVEPGYVLQQWPCSGSFPGGAAGRTISAGDSLPYYIGNNMPTSKVLRARYRHAAVYTDANCQTEAVGLTYTYPTTIPAFRARDITSDSATIYYEGGRETHLIGGWRYTLTPGSGDCSTYVRVTFAGQHNEQSIYPTLSGLSAGTTYTYRVYPGSDR